MSATLSEASKSKELEADESRWLETVERQARSLKFGSILITIHEGRVVQVETSVKVRFDKP